MTRYVSTRGRAPTGFLSDVTLIGLAEDKGLYIPMSIPHASSRMLRRMRSAMYAEAVMDVFQLFAGDDPVFTPEVIERLSLMAYSGHKWECQDVVPVVALGHQVYAAELFHGPTLAFKDLALQLLAPAIQHILEVRGERLTILVSTSGDTGPAAMEAFAGMENVDMFVMYPQDGTSRIQRKQMTTTGAKNAHAIGIDGTFDDCQRIMKSLKYGAVNSVNWFRIMAQVAYYFWAYAQADQSDGPVDFAVPTGNFGNIYAGYVARMMGLPIRSLILCTNENDMLVDFFATGTYRPKRVIPSTAPSMDISVSSNAERIVRALYDDPSTVESLYVQQLSEHGSFHVDPSRLRETGIVAVGAGEDARHEMMRKAKKDLGYIMDPHTAAGFVGGLQKRDPDIPLVVLATASLAKFEDTARAVLGEAVALPPSYADLDARPERFVGLPADHEKVRDYIERTRRH